MNLKIKFLLHLTIIVINLNYDRVDKRKVYSLNMKK